MPRAVLRDRQKERPNARVAAISRRSRGERKKYVVHEIFCRLVVADEPSRERMNTLGVRVVHGGERRRRARCHTRQELEIFTVAPRPRLAFVARA